MMLGEPTDPQTQERKAEKSTAIDGIGLALTAIAERRREPDAWERNCLAHALSAVFNGYYVLAMTDAQLALTPPDQRSTQTTLPSDPVFDRFNLAVLTRAWRAAKGAPLQLFPQLGPDSIG